MLICKKKLPLERANYQHIGEAWLYFQLVHWKLSITTSEQ